MNTATLATARCRCAHRQLSFTTFHDDASKAPATPSPWRNIIVSACQRRGRRAGSLKAKAMLTMARSARHHQPQPATPSGHAVAAFAADRCRCTMPRRQWPLVAITTCFTRLLLLSRGALIASARSAYREAPCSMLPGADIADGRSREEIALFIYLLSQCLCLI